MMHLRFLSCIVTLVAWLAAAAQPLNSERIEQAFGSYGIDVILSEDRLRLSNLYSTHDGERTMRTFAIVRYPDRVADAFAREHAEILAGSSIGATFQAAGWEVVKLNRYFGGIAAPEALADPMRITANTRLAVHVYALEIRRGRERHEYALVAEIHHPDYLSLEELVATYAPDSVPEDRAADRAPSNAARDFMLSGLEALRARGSALGE